MDGFYDGREGIYLRDYKVNNNINSFVAIPTKNAKNEVYHSTKDGNIHVDSETAEKINKQKFENLHTITERENFTIPGVNVPDSNIIIFVVIVLFLYLIYSVNKNANDIKKMYMIILMGENKSGAHMLI